MPISSDHSIYSATLRPHPISAAKPELSPHQMGRGSEITMLKAVPAQAGNGWRVFIQWASGRIQYISGFESLQDAELGAELAERAKHPIVAIKRKPQTCRGFQTGDLRETPRARCPRRPPILSQSTNQARRGS